MGIYGADVDQLRELAQRLQAGSESLDGARRTLNSSITHAAWKGPSGERFRGSWSGELAPALTAAATSLRDAAASIRSNADEQERTSTDGGSATGSTGGRAPGSEAGPDREHPTVKTTVKGSHKTDDGNGIAAPGTGTKSTLGIGGKIDPTTGAGTSSVDASTSRWSTDEFGNKTTVGANAGLSHTDTVTSKDGYTTYTHKDEGHVGASGTFGSETGVSIGGGVSTGYSGGYSVKVPDSAGLTSDKGIDPLDPSTWPVGTTVTRDGSAYVKTDGEAAFRNIAVESSVKHSSGVSSVIERTGENTLRITDGPTAAIAKHAGIGLEFEKFKLMVGGSALREGTSIRSAELDLSTPDGQAAYQHYLATGELPKEASPGVSGVSSTVRLDYKSSATIAYSTPFGGNELEVPMDSGTKIMTTHPDGSTDQVTSIHYENGRDFVMSQSFTATGQEERAERTYTYDVVVNESNARYLNDPQFSDFVSGPAAPGQTLTMTISEPDMADIAAHVRRELGEDELSVREEFQGLSDIESLKLAGVLASSSRDDTELVELLADAMGFDRSTAH